MPKRIIWIDTIGEYKPGDPPPDGYCEWHAWAEVQGKAGLKQVKCAICSLWKFPQELSERVLVSHPTDSLGNQHTLESPICKGCEQL